MKHNIKFIIPFLILSSFGLSAADEIRVGYNNWIGYIAFFVAQEEGMFEDEGLNVVASTFDAPGDGLIPLLSGSLDLHLTTADAVLHRADKVPGQLKIVGLVDTSYGADAVVVSPEIESLQDLKGEKVGVTMNECNHLLLIKALESVGMSEFDVEIVNMDPDLAGTALRAGQIKAAVTWEPWISLIIGSGGRSVYSTKQAPNLILDCIAVSQDSMEEKEVEIKKFLKVWNDATRFVVKNPEEAAEIVEDVVELPADEIIDILEQVKFYDARGSKELMIGMAAHSASEMASFFKEKETAETVVDVETIFDATLLP